MYWFLRESIKFGTHSRKSMLYDLPEMQYFYEAAIIGIGICNYLGNKNITFFEKVKTKIEDVKKLNDNFINDKLNDICTYSHSLDTEDFNEKLSIILDSQ